ncbi:MAG: hypothetical protein LBC59_06675 [Chitinispirillales bacterium]|jgi:hypothetical protein|nr:hypothetical protein [Chitinispirillales bacterium]
MRNLIAGAMVAGLILGAAAVSAVSAQDWSIGFEGRFSDNFGGGFKGDVTSPVTDTIFVKIMPKFVSVKTSVWNGIRTETPIIVGGETVGVNVKDSTWWVITADSGLVGGITDSIAIIKRAMPDTKEMLTPHYSGGAGVFFASKYAEASFGLSYMGGTWKRKVVGQNEEEPTYTFERVVTDTVRSTIAEGDDNTTITVTYDSIRVIRDGPARTNYVAMNSEWERDISALNFNIGLWLKYPYDLSDAVKLFPIAGIEYELCTIISKEIRRVWPANTWSRTWFKAGIGSDIDVSERVYIHPVVMYGVGWKNSIERDIVKEGGVMVDTRISHGLSARVGIGYRFDAD